METKTIVVADDLPAIRRIMERTLAGPGVRVIPVGDGRQACEAARSQAPDLVILDICMPVMDGIDAAAEIRRAQGPSGVPILMITAAGDSRKGIEGADDWLAKPFELSELADRVERLVAIGRRRRAVAA